VKATVGVPYYAKNGKVGAPAHGRYLYFRDAEAAHIVCAVLNSSLLYSYFIAYGDCFHLSDTLATSFPLASFINGDKIFYDELNVSESKPILDETDRALATHYGFTEEKLDFIINYDIKYRMGRDAELDDE